MPEYTLAQLQEPRTTDGEFENFRSVLVAEGFKGNDWNTGSAQRTTAKAIASGIASVSRLGRALAQRSLIALARKLPSIEWMAMIAGFYDLTPVEATYTVQRCRLACAAGAGPQTANSGFTALARVSGRRYVYKGSAPVVIPDNGSALIDLTAESPGSKYADQAEAINEIVTSLPGVTISNPAGAFGGLDDLGRARKSSTAQGTGTITPSAPSSEPSARRFYTVTVTASGSTGAGSVKVEYIETLPGGLPTKYTAATFTPIPATPVDLTDGIILTFANGPGTGFVRDDVHTFETPGSPIIVQGADAETPEQLAQRCIGRWASLSPNFPAGKYHAMVVQCSVDNGFGIEKVAVRESSTEGGVAEIYVATVSGAPAGGVLTTLQNYVNARTGVGDRGQVIGARNREVGIAGSVTVKLDKIQSAMALADEKWAAVIASLPIAGDISTGKPGLLRLSALASVLGSLQAAGEIVSFDLASLRLDGVAADLVLASTPIPDVAIIPSGQEPSTALVWNPVA